MLKQTIAGTAISALAFVRVLSAEPDYPPKLHWTLEETKAGFDGTVATVNDTSSSPITVPTPDLMKMIESWLAHNFGFQATGSHPNVEFASAVKLTSLRYKSLYSKQLPNAGANTNSTSLYRRTVMAVYGDTERTIYLPETWTGESPQEMSILVHEMVHHLQNISKQTFECPMEREKQAYEAQDRWLRMFGKSLESEFEIDGMTLLVTTSCVMGALSPP